MHSSRMRTVRNSSRLLGGASPGGGLSRWVLGPGGYLVGRGGCLLLGGGGGRPGLGGVPSPGGVVSPYQVLLNK